MQTMKPSDLTAKEFFQLTVNSLLELCTHSIDSHRIVSIEGRLLLSLDTGDKVELNILEQDINRLLESVKTENTNTSLSGVVSDAVKNEDGDLPRDTEARLTDMDDRKSLSDISVQKADSASESELEGTCEDEGDKNCNDTEILPSAVLQLNGEFMCSSCGEKMQSARAIKRHVSEHMNEELSGTRAVLYHKTTDKTQAVTKKRAKKKEVNPRKHMSRLDTSEDSSNPWRSYVCKDCGEKFTTNSFLDLHRVQMHRPYKCQKCGSVLIGRRNFSSHVRNDHPGLHICKAQKSFVCEYCSRTFHDESQMKDHISTVHLGDTEHRCDQCGKVLGSAITLVIHQRQLHERRFQQTCDGCGRQFTRFAGLINHLTRTHPHLLPDKYRHRLEQFSCQDCDARFLRHSLLQRHIEIRHGGAPKYICPVCSRRFSCRRYVLRHVRNHHPSAIDSNTKGLKVEVDSTSLPDVLTHSADDMSTM